MTETVKTPEDEANKEPAKQSSKSTSKFLRSPSDGTEHGKPSDKNEKPPTKVVVRRLPPTMTLETFVEQVSPLPPVDYMYFVKADSSLSPNAFSRAYLHFIHVQDLLIFTEKFDCYVFLDSKGNEYPAVVEYAPFQRIPKQRSTRKKDPRMGTIENDPFYIGFLEALKEEEEQRKTASKSKQHFFETSSGSQTPKVTNTPLLEYLKAKHADRLRTKDDKINERKKKELEKRKIREDSRAARQMRLSEGDGDYTHGKERTGDSKRSVRESNIKKREEERNRIRERKEREKHKDHGDYRDQRHDEKENDKEKNHDQNKENEASAPENKYKESRRGGKSYAEERQRLNERRQAAKSSSKNVNNPSEAAEKSSGEAIVENNFEKKAPYKKYSDSHDKSKPYDKYKSSDQNRVQINKETKKTDKTSRNSYKDHDYRRNYDTKPYEGKKNGDDRYRKGGQETESKKGFSRRSESQAEDTGYPDVDSKSDSVQSKEETRKKSYNLDREQRRAADRKVATIKKDGVQDSTSDGKTHTTTEDENTKTEGSVDTTNSKPINAEDLLKGAGDYCPEKEKKSSSIAKDKDESSRSKPTRDVSSDNLSQKTENSESGSKSKDRKDPRVERRIRNKDRPTMELYRPGMGRFSRQRLEREKGLGVSSSTERDSPSSSPSPVPNSSQTTVGEEK